MANRAVSISLYRAMWRWTATEPMRSARYAVPVEQLPLSVLASLSTKSDSLSGRAGAQRLIREAWRAGAALTEPGEIKQQLDGAFACLRIMGDFQEEVVGLVERRTANADRRGIAFQIGQVLRHRKYGFRGVVVGWDRRPQVDVSGWDGVQGLPSGPDQPFYRVLPDMGDCVELLGGPRDVRYVAQENLVEVPAAHRRISHPGIDSVVPVFDAASARFLPTEELAFEYPGSPLATPPRPARPAAADHAAGRLAHQPTDEGGAARTLLSSLTHVRAAAQREHAHTSAHAHAYVCTCTCTCI
jgi:hemimethylated DNA binding protein